MEDKPSTQPDQKWLISVIETRTYERVVTAPTREKAQEMARTLQIQRDQSCHEHTELSEPAVERLVEVE